MSFRGYTEKLDGGLLSQDHCLIGSIDNVGFLRQDVPIAVYDYVETVRQLPTGAPELATVYHFIYQHLFRYEAEEGVLPHPSKIIINNDDLADNPIASLRTHEDLEWKVAEGDLTVSEARMLAVIRHAAAKSLTMLPYLSAEADIEKHVGGLLPLTATRYLLYDTVYDAQPEKIHFETDLVKPTDNNEGVPVIPTITLPGVNGGQPAQIMELFPPEPLVLVDTCRSAFIDETNRLLAAYDLGNSR